VDVHDLGLGQQRPGLAPGPQRFHGLGHARRAQAPRPATDEVDAVRVLAIAEGQELHGVAAPAQGLAEQMGQQRVRGLVGRQVRRDHQDVHPAHSRANSARRPRPAPSGPVRCASRRRRSSRKRATLFSSGV
jgi:hypothetical protein